MNRRDFVYLSTSSLLLSNLASPLLGAMNKPFRSDSNRLFFDPADLSRIRANARTPLLGPLFDTWTANGPDQLQIELDAFDESGDLIRGFPRVLNELSQSTVVQLVEPNKDRLRSLLAGLERIIEIPDWDYFLDGDEVISFQRASSAVDHVTFVREALSDEISKDLDRRLLDALAEKGCLPCYRSVVGMDNPELVKGWHFNERHADYYDIDMSRWPEILGANNLRAHPTSSLGVGALALRGHDERADVWLEKAISSARRTLTLFSDDGSYFEGISYVGYTLRTLFVFFEAHQRAVGDIEWAKETNLEGILNYILSTQMGRNADGTPDVVNFSDASGSVYPHVPAWIGRNTNNPLAQYAVENASKPFSFVDFLWYDPDVRSMEPPKSLENVHNDLDWVICRSGWDADDAVLAFKSGGPANHEHNDRNHITYKIYGERLLNDHFGASYDNRQPHWLLRMNEAHNAVLVDGKGHHYHQGEEGTHESLSFANIVQYHVDGETTYWTSDATSAYRIDNKHVVRVLRTVIFAKPDIILILDQVRTRYHPQPVALRFFPDNRDEEAALAVNGSQFFIGRPNASLHGQVASLSEGAVSQSMLELPAEYGQFPFIQVDSGPALRHEIVSLLAATPGKSTVPPSFAVQKTEGGWEVDAAQLHVSIDTTRNIPSIRIR